MRKITIGIMVLLISLPIAYSLLQKSSTKTQETETILLGAQLDHLYTNVKELSDGSDLVIKGFVGDSYTWGSGGSMISNYTIKLDETIKGTTNEKSIYVYMHGGVEENKEYIFENDPLLVKGDTVILFIKKSHTHPSSYFVTGMGQGKYVVQEGKVFHICELNADSAEFSNLYTNGIDINSFISQLK